MNEYNIITHVGDKHYLKIVEANTYAGIVKRNPLMREEVKGNFFSELNSHEIGEIFYANLKNAYPKESVKKFYNRISRKDKGTINILIGDGSVCLENEALSSYESKDIQMSYLIMASYSIRESFSRSKKTSFQKQVESELREI